MSGKRRAFHGLIIAQYSIVPIVYFLDQFSKFYIRKLVFQGPGIPLIKNIIHLTLVHNTGAAFGMFRKYPHLFVVFAILAAALIAYFLVKCVDTLSSPEKTALCLILGGTLGNLTDRIRFGYVVDFIDLRIWPVFNLADTFITIGAAILVWTVVVEFRRNQKKKRVGKSNLGS